MRPDYDSESLRFKALGHPARLHILDVLRRGEACVCHIEAEVGRRQAYISQQLMVLREMGLVEARKDGMKVFYRIADTAVLDLLARTVGPIPPDEPVGLQGCPCEVCGQEPIEAILDRRRALCARREQDAALD